MDAAVAGDEVVVTNGIYAIGGPATAGDSATNRVAMDKPITLRSISGPQFTTDLVSGIWLPLTTFTGPVTNGNQETITDISPPPPAKFYRIDISKP